MKAIDRQLVVSGFVRYFYPRTLPEVNLVVSVAKVWPWNTLVPS